MFVTTVFFDIWLEATTGTPTRHTDSRRTVQQKVCRLQVEIVRVKLQEFNVNKNPTRCKYLLTAKSLYMFRVSQHSSSGVLKTVTAASGTGHNTGTATPLQRGPIRPRWREVAAPVV